MRKEYTPLVWVNDETPLSAENLNNMEQGIKYNNDLSLENAGYIDEIYKAFVEQLNVSYDSTNDVFTFSFGSATGNDITKRFHKSITFSLGIATTIAESIADKADKAGPLPTLQFDSSQNVLEKIDEYGLNGKIVVFWYNGSKYVGMLSKQSPNGLRFEFSSFGGTPVIVSYNGYIQHATNIVFRDLFADEYKHFSETQDNKTDDISDESAVGAYPTALAVNYFVKQNVAKWQSTATIVIDALTNINGKHLTTFTATHVNADSEHPEHIHIKKIVESDGGTDEVECNSEHALDYIFRMSGTKYLPYYDYDHPRNSYWIMADGSFWKPQYTPIDDEQDHNYEGLYLFKMPSLFEVNSNKVTSMSANSTNTQYPSAKAVYDLVNNRSNLVTLLGNASQSLEGLMSAQDKARLDTLYALLGDTADANTVVDTINEVLAIFNQYAEGADLVNVLAGKAEKTGELPSYTVASSTLLSSFLSGKNLFDKLFVLNISDRNDTYIGRIKQKSSGYYANFLRIADTNAYASDPLNCFVGQFSNSAKFADVFAVANRYQVEFKNNKLTASSPFSYDSWNDTKYPTARAVYDQLVGKLDKSGGTMSGALYLDSLLYSNFGEFRFNDHLNFTDNTDNHNVVMQLFYNDVLLWKTLTCKSALNVDGLIWVGGKEIRFPEYVDFKDNTNEHNVILRITPDYINAEKVMTFKRGANIDVQPTENQHAVRKDYADALVARNNLVNIIGDATQQVSGLFSSTDKTHLDTLMLLLGENADVDTVVNTLNEVLAVFNQYPEGVTVANALAGKANASEVYTTSEIDAMFMNATTDVDDIMED